MISGLVYKFQMIILIISYIYMCALLSVVCRRAHVYLTFFCVCLHIVVSNTYCFSSSCVPYVACFSGLFIFLLSFRYSLTFTYTRSFISALYLLISDSRCLYFISSLYKKKSSLPCVQIYSTVNRKQLDIQFGLISDH